MKKIIFILLILELGCGHKKIKGNRNIETPTSSGIRSGLTIRPERIGLGRNKKQRIYLQKNYPDYDPHQKNKK